MKKIIGVILSLCLVVLVLPGFSCNDFEKTSFQSLSADKAIVDKAEDDYNQGLIHKTQENYELIMKAKGVQDTGVNALLAYHDVRVAANATSDKVANAQGAVDAALTELPGLIVQIKALK